MKIRFFLLWVLVYIFSGCAGKDALSSSLEEKVGSTNYPKMGLEKSFVFDIPSDTEEAFFYLPQNSSTVMLKVPLNENIMYIKVSDTRSGLNIDKILPATTEMKGTISTNGQDIYFSNSEDKTLYIKIHVPLVYTYKQTYSPTLDIAYHTATDIDRLRKKVIQLHFAYRSYHTEVSTDKKDENPLYDSYTDFSSKEDQANFDKQKLEVNEKRIKSDYFK